MLWRYLRVKLGTAVACLAALAHESRLSVFRLLVKAGAQGMPAGELARSVGVLPNTLSTHLNILGQAGLTKSRRDGRSIVYTADYARMRKLLEFLLEDCCQGRIEICAPLAEITRNACCTGETA